MPIESRAVYEHATHTRALVSFHTDEPGGLSIPTPVSAHPRLGRIIAVTTKKSLGEASGTFTIQVKKNNLSQRGLASALRAPPDGLWRDPEDVWVRIKWLVDGQIIDGMLGMIDTVSEDTGRSGGGARSETYTISGRDMGKVFETTELLVNFHHAPERPLRSQAALTAAMLPEIIGVPSHFITVLVEEWVGNHGAAEQQFMLPRSLSGTSFHSVLSKAGVEDMVANVSGISTSPTLFQIDQTGGKLWDVMQEYANGLMNELFVDLASPGDSGLPTDGAPVNAGTGAASSLQNLTPTLFHRERPFPIRSDDGRTTNATKWNSLPTHILRPGDIQRRSVAKGGAAHRFNYWQIQLHGIGTEGFNVDEILQRGIDGVRPGDPGNIPIWSTESIQKHGVRRYLATTRYLPFYVQRMGELSQSDRENFFRLAARWLKKIHDWFVIAPLEISGTLITTRVQPEIRIGQRVQEVRAEGTITYYVEDVESRYTYGQGGSTTITVTRGEYEHDELLDYIYAQYENPQALDTAESCFSQLGGERDLGVTEAEFEELDLFGADCRLTVPPDGTRGQILLLGRLTSDAVVGQGEGFELFRQQQRSLAIEHDGRGPRPGSPRQLIRAPQSSLDDSEPSVGDAERIPPAGESSSRQGQPSIDQQSLERGEPIDADDPIGGLDLQGDER